MFGMGGPMGLLASGDLRRALSGVGESIASGAFAGASQLTSMQHKSGETNRYTKAHHQRVITEPPRSIRPSAFANLNKCTSYEYANLSSDGNIRLLRLMPPQVNLTNLVSNSEDIVVCQIEEVRLEDGLHYEALSYAWGVQPRDYPVLINQGPVYPEDNPRPCALFVSPSLHAALKRLRNPTKDRLLWIDQLSINQADSIEKKKQVMLMAEIYGKAQRTIVWLGEEDKDHNVLSEMVNLFASKPSSNQLNDLNIIRPLLDLRETSQITRGSWRRQALIRLLNRSWFSRAWVFQEAVKSPHVDILCGSLEMPLKVLMRLSQAAFHMEENEKGYAHSLTKSTTGFDMLYQIEHSRPNSCGQSGCERQEFKPGWLGLLLQVLQQVDATNNRDLIYAFLAFKGDVEIIPDYDAPVSLVWREAATSIIKSTGSLDIFAAVRGDHPPSEPVPSWTPDWSHCYPYARPICAPDFKSTFKACNGLLKANPDTADGRGCPHLWEDSLDSETLVVKGKIIGTVSWLSPPNFEGGYYRDGLVDFLGLSHHFGFLDRYLRLTGRYQVTNEQLMRTLLADGAFGHIQPLPDPPRDIIRICKEEQDIEAELRNAGHGRLSPQLERRKALLDRVRQWSLVAQQKKVFVCRKAAEEGAGALDLGLAPRAVKVGDVVVLLRGSKTPCLLRTLENGKWRVIGQCYLDGWMYGEIPEGRKMGNSEEKFDLI